MTLSRRAVILASLASCAAPQPPRDGVPIAPGVTMRLPGADELGRSVEAAQMVRARYQGRDIVFEGQVSITPERLLLACIDPFGRPALTMRWERERVSAQVADTFPPSLHPENMLADIMLIYWPQASLCRSLTGSNAVVIDEPNRRIVLSSQQPIIRIDYGSSDRWNGTAAYESLSWGYSLDVQSEEVRS